MINEYIIQEKLGTGSYGTVYKVTKKNTNDLYVLKQISLFGLTEEEIKEVKLEAKILSSIDSIYVVKYYNSFEEKNFLNIVMEYCNGGDLGKFIEEKKEKKENIKEDLIWTLFIKITIGLAAIHKLKILHRDLKTLNIFLTKDLDIKIGDLGVAKVLNHSGSFAKTLIGTPYYLSPELCEEKPYNYKSDVWALGCILYELCTFKHPFNAKSQAALILKILQSRPEPIGNNYSNDLQNLINDLFEKKMQKRPSCKEILKKNIIIEKAKSFGLFNKILELYPELNDNCNNSLNTPTNMKENNNNKLIYYKNRYPKIYKIKDNIQKNYSNSNINNIDINNNISNNNINYINKRNKIKHKAKFNSISTDSRSAIRNILNDNNNSNENDLQVYQVISNQKKIINYIYNINDQKNINNNNSNNISKPFVKKPLNKFPISYINKKDNIQNLYNGRYINIEQYNNLLNKNGESKEKKAINKSCKSAKKLLINLNGKTNLSKKGISLITNKSNGRKKFIIHKSNNLARKTENKIINNNNNYENNVRNFVWKDNSNLNHINPNLNLNLINNNITNNNDKHESENNGSNMNIENQSQINVNESIEKFENKLKNYYQYSPEIQAKRAIYNNFNRNNLKTPNKENSISDDILLKLTPTDIINTNNNNDLMNIVEVEYKKSNGKVNNLMEFVNNLNNYVPQYKISNQNSKNKKITKSNSISITGNITNYGNIQKQFNNNMLYESPNNNFFINNNNI